MDGYKEMSRRHVDEVTIVQVECHGHIYKFVISTNATCKLQDILRRYFTMPFCCNYHRIVGLDGNPCVGLNKEIQAQQQVVISANGKESVKAIDLRPMKGHWY